MDGFLCLFVCVNVKLSKGGRVLSLFSFFKFLFVFLSSRPSFVSLLLADLVLSNKLVLYDLENQTIGWTEYNCKYKVFISLFLKLFLNNTSCPTFPVFAVICLDFSVGFSPSFLNHNLMMEDSDKFSCKIRTGIHRNIYTSMHILLYIGLISLGLFINIRFKTLCWNLILVLLCIIAILSWNLILVQMEVAWQICPRRHLITIWFLILSKYCSGLRVSLLCYLLCFENPRLVLKTKYIYFENLIQLLPYERWIHGIKIVRS